MSRMSWHGDGRLRCYGVMCPFIDFGTVDSKIGREGSGRYGCRAGSTATVSTGNTGLLPHPLLLNLRAGRVPGKGMVRR